MSRSENLQTSDKTYYIPLEVTESRKKSAKYNGYTVKLAWIEGRLVMSFMVPVSKEVYDTYMHFEWKEAKYQQRHGNMVSLDDIWASYEIEPCDDSKSVEEEVEERDLSSAIKKEILKLEKKDRTILVMHSKDNSEREIAPVVNMSQRGVGKRKNRLFDELHEALEDFK